MWWRVLLAGLVVVVLGVAVVQYLSGGQRRASGSNEGSSPGRPGGAAVNGPAEDARGSASASRASESAPATAAPDAGAVNGVADAVAGEKGVGKPVPMGKCREGFVYVPPGTFVMGSPEDEPGRGEDEGPQHRVTLTHGFCLGRTEVTQGQFERLMGVNPSHFKDCGADCPVERVTWWDALAYANAVSRAAGLRPCYRLRGCTGKTGAGARCSGVEVLAPGADPYRCEGYRLPAEAEWEYAYRAGTTTAFYNGPITKPRGRDPKLDAIGWYRENSDDHPHPVASKAPNAWGLYDMAGNVWEWCWDWYGEHYYAHSPVENPHGPASGTTHVERGGPWSNDAQYARAAYRFYVSPGLRYDDLGFRLARTVNP